MKPSEKRALKAQQAAEKSESAEKVSSPKEAQAASAPEPSEIKSKEKSSSEQTKYKRKEGFFQSHVRLITFIITASIILTIFGPLGIDLIIRNKKAYVVDNKQYISLESVYTVHDNADRIKWKNFNKFNYSDYSYDSDSGKYYIREYPVKGTGLVLRVGGADMTRAPDYVYLIDYNKGNRIDILKDDPKEFIEGYSEAQ